MSSEMVEVVRLDSHPNARNQAVAIVPIKEGSTITKVRAYVTALLPSQKSLRCDECFRAASEDCHLKRCQGCASYWYCSTACQISQWNLHHKKLCKIYNSFTAAKDFQALEAYQKMDAILLAHFIASSKGVGSSEQSNSEASDEGVFRDLLPGPDLGTLPPIPKLKLPVTNQEAADIYSRFGNNNFTIHSHFNSVGHGVFPMASRLFNHSCLANAAAKYRFDAASPVYMEIVALRDIAAGEQICIPYVDPALTETRRKIFEFTYGFRCDCDSCIWLRSLGAIPPPPQSSEDIKSITERLRSIANIDDIISSGIVTQCGPPRNIPLELVCTISESFMTSTSEAFSKASHEGSYEVALDAGITLTALYLLIYPRNYPQIGLHLLELAKVAWNKLVTASAGDVEEVSVKSKAKSFLSLAEGILKVLGKEGDEDGPLKEIAVLRSLLDGE